MNFLQLIEHLKTHGKSEVRVLGGGGKSVIVDYSDNLLEDIMNGLGGDISINTLFSVTGVKEDKPSEPFQLVRLDTTGPLYDTSYITIRISCGSCHFTVPSGYRYIATDRDGSTYLYEELPDEKPYYFYGTDCLYIGKFEYTGDWRDSVKKIGSDGVVEL